MTAASLFWCSSAFAQSATTYHLFSPVPREQLRELSPDRPSITESPFTVDAGHFQIETELVGVSLDTGSDYRRTEVAFAATNLRAGLSPWMDLQLLLEPYHRSTLKDLSDAGANGTVVEDGYGATTLRLKLNFWGNDGGATALGLMPFVTVEDSRVDFGLILPLAGELPLELSYGVMLESDVVALEKTNRRGFELVTAGTLGRALFGPLGGYVEVASTYAAHDAGESTLSFEAGLTLGVLPNLQLDVGSLVGLVGPVDDVQLSLGVTGRL